MEILSQAIGMAVTAHRDQMDTDGMPHIIHVLRVMMKVAKEFKENPIPGYTLEEIMTAAVLHDTVEDSPITLDKIEAMYGGKVRDIVDGLSRRKFAGDEKETYRDFIYRAKQNPAGRFIKTADLLDNLNRLTPDKAGMEKRYSIALSVLNDEDEPSWEEAGRQFRDGIMYVPDPEGQLVKKGKVHGN
jgi:(p)ppGpp synthase/HD superfamily hydrolase